ncbi:hypothetical protein RRG08_066030, partial [Elysia crispata]
FSRWSKTVADMLGSAVAVTVGLVAVLWYFNDSTKLLANLKGKRVLVTGASRGIGEQLAYQFARHGCHVTITARRRAALEEVSKKCSSLSPSDETNHVIIGDMQNLNMTKSIVERAVAEMGGLDLLVLNHILPHPIQAFKGDKEDLDLLLRLLNVNFRSYVHLASHALPHLLKSKGRIIVINSAIGKISHPFLASYAATKHALDGFFSSLRIQFQATGQEVGITSCFLGYIGTASAVKGIQATGETRLQWLIKPASPSDTAQAIALAAASGEDELYYPWFDVRPMIVLHSVWPKLVDSIMRFIS